MVAHLEHLAARKRKIATANMYALTMSTFDALAAGERLTQIRDPGVWTRLVAHYASTHAITSVQTATAVLKSLIVHANDGNWRLASRRR